MKRDVLTLSNLLSISRALLVIPFLLVMLSGAPWSRAWGCVIIAVAALTDKLDGYFARKFHEETELGRVLDPLADKIGIAAGALVLLLLGAIPLWFVVALIARDLLILTGGLVLKARTGKVLSSNQSGKWAVGVIAATLFVALADAPAWIVTGGIVASSVMLAVSLTAYVRRFLDVLTIQNG